MEYRLLYYSGAGNTEYLSEVVEAGLFKRGSNVKRQRITVRNWNHLKDDFDILGVGYPIYFREAPQLVYDCLSRLDGRGRGIFVFCTKGLYSGNATRNVLSFAHNRGFEPRGFYECYMPGTDALLLLAKKGSVLERSLKAVYSKQITDKVDELIAYIEGGPGLTVPSPKWYTMLDKSIVKPIERWMDDEHRIWVQRFHILSSRCNKCELCVHGCPRNNIHLTETGITFGNECDICFRCIHRCPTEAIQIGDRTLHTVRYIPKRDLRVTH